MFSTKTLQQQLTMQQMWRAYLRMEPMNCIIDPKGSSGGLFLGNLDAAQNVDLLKNHNIGAVLTVAAKAGVSYDKSHNIRHEIIKADDVENYDLFRHFGKMLDFIERNIHQTNVLVHCYAGVSRSATAVIAYLMKTSGWTMDKSLQFCRSRRKITNPNPGFVRQLLIYEKRLREKTEQNASEIMTNNRTNNLLSQTFASSFQLQQNDISASSMPSYKNQQNMMSQTVNRLRKERDSPQNDDENQQIRSNSVKQEYQNTPKKTQFQGSAERKVINEEEKHHQQMNMMYKTFQQEPKKDHQNSFDKKSLQSPIKILEKSSKNTHLTHQTEENNYSQVQSLQLPQIQFDKNNQIIQQSNSPQFREVPSPFRSSSLQSRKTALRSQNNPNNPLENNNSHYQNTKIFASSLRNGNQSPFQNKVNKTGNYFDVTMSNIRKFDAYKPYLASSNTPFPQSTYSSSYGSVIKKTALNHAYYPTRRALFSDRPAF